MVLNSKLHHIPAALALILSVCATAVSCEKEKEEPKEEPKVQLQTPSPSLSEVSSSWAELKWQDIPGALYYSIYLGEDEHPVMSIEPGVTLRGLSPLTDYNVTVTADPASRSKYLKSEKSTVVSFTTTGRPCTAEPEITVSDLTTTSFMLSWNEVEKSSGFIYTFGLKGESVEETATTETEMSFSGLTPGATYVFRLRSVPSEEYEAEYDPSSWAEENITLPLPQPLAAPTVKVERASSIHTEISWQAVPDAAQYEYMLDPKTPVGEGWEPAEDEKTSLTTDLKAVFEGLEKESVHTFIVRACSDDLLVRLNSPWTSVDFTAAYDFVPTLRIDSATPAATKISLKASVDQVETYLAGILPKAAYLTEEGEIDVEALTGKIMEGFSADNLRRESISEDFDACYGTTYICYVYGVGIDGIATSGLKYVEAKTADFASAIPEGPNFALSLSDGSWTDISASSPIDFNSYWTYSTSATGSVTYRVQRTDESKTFTKIKYSLLKYDAFVSNYGTSADAAAAKLNTYFETSGTTMSDSNKTKVNSGTAASGSYTPTDGARYVMAMRAEDADGGVYLYAVSVQAHLSTAEWIHASGISESAKAGKFTVTSDLPVTEGKASAYTLSTSNYRPELLPAYMESRGTALTAARITSLNAGSSYSASYNTLTSGSTYIYILRIVNAAGDVAFGCGVAKIQ